MPQPIVLLGQSVALGQRRIALGDHTAQQAMQRVNVLGKRIGQNHCHGAIG